MADIFPPSIQGAGTVRLQWVPALTNPAAPTLTELNGTDALDVTPYCRADQFAIALAQDRLDDTRLSDDTKREGLGLATYSIDTFRYIHNPQAAALAQGNKAYDTFKPGVSGYFILRYGTKTMKSAAAFVATQRLGLGLNVTFGEQLKAIPTGDNAVHVIEQQVTLTRTFEDFTLA